MSTRAHQLPLELDQNRVDITVYLHSFGYSKGGVRRIRGTNRHPLALNYLIDARFLPRVHTEPDLQALDGLNEKVCDFLNRRNDLDEFVRRELEILIGQIDFWNRNRIKAVNIGIGSKYGRHRAVAVQERLARYLEKRLYERCRIRARVVKRYFGDVTVPTPASSGVEAGPSLS